MIYPNGFNNQINMMKKLLLKIAQLPKKHQLWIINQLPDDLRKKFTSQRGSDLLQEAKVFNKLKGALPKPPLNNLSDNLPLIAQQLTDTSTLFTAIILHEGQFNWTEPFLNQHARQQQIRQFLSNNIPDIKEKTRKLVFQTWAKNQLFEELLEVSHG